MRIVRILKRDNSSLIKTDIDSLKCGKRNRLDT